MHTVYLGKKPIILTCEIEKETNFKTFLLKTVNIGKVIRLLNKTDINGVHLIHHRKDKLLPKFIKLLPNVIAGGGKVYNAKNEILFIYRNNKWDLPKGKIEAEEAITDTAIREVEEETGVTGLKIIKPLPTTYHIFKRDDQYKIKITYWFEMKTNYNSKLHPQKKEGITMVKWLDLKSSKKALQNSYANIKHLV